MTNNQNQNQLNQHEQQIQQQNEAKTVINGQVVPLKSAQAAVEAADQQSTQTGIQAHHDNSSEAVQAGQTAQNSQAASSQAQQQQSIKQANVQSGQQHLNQHMNQSAQSEAQKIAKEDHQTIQNSMNAAAKGKTTKKAD
jgi:hypothetical protein